MKEKHAALYVRVSTDAQREEGYSIEAQTEMLKAYCVSKRIDEYELFVDGGFSGSSIERPEVKRMIDAILHDEISHVIVYKLDRLSRSQKDTLYLIEDVFIPHNVSFVSLNENMDTSTPIGRAMLGIMSAFAQLERETIRERTRMGMKERVKSGLWRGGGHVPFGYDYDSEKGVLVPNEDAETVRMMYDMYLRGASMMSIAQKVGLKYEHLASQILKRKTNCGYIVYNGVEYKGKHEPIISEEKYEMAIELMKKRARGKLTTAKSLLAGLLVCGVCGAKMRYQKWGKNSYKIYCYSRDKGKPHLHKGTDCDNERVDADEIEGIVIGDLFRMARSENHDGLSAGDVDLRGLYASKIQMLSKKLKNLYNLYAQSENELLLATIEENRAELEEAKSKLEAEERKSESEKKSSAAREELTKIEQAWNFMSIEEKQSVLRSYIEKIVITRNKADIYYNI